MSYFEIYLIGVALAFAYVIFLIEKNSKDTSKFKFGFKLFFVVASSIFSWIFIVGMSANLLGKKFKR